MNHEQLIPAKLKYYPVIIGLDRCNGSCNSNCDLSLKICIRSKTKDVNVKVFNTITNRNKAKILVKSILWDCECKFNSTTWNSNQKWNNETCQCKCKKNTCKKGYRWNPSTCTCENDSSVVDDSRLFVIMLYMLWVLYQEMLQVLY